MKKENTGRVVREPAVAGAFYPGGRGSLEKTIKGFMGGVPGQRVDGRIVGLISPHAGYTYSGRTAAYGYSLIAGKGFKRAIVLAPSHRVGFRGAALPGADAFRTPLGLIPVDRAACRELLSNDLYIESSEAHGDEHSLEVQLPFLQEALGDFNLVPIVVGQLRKGDYAVIAAPLRRLLDEKTIIIASSDFTHYGISFGYAPFTGDIKENLEKLDLGAVEKIEKMDAMGFIEYCEETGATICGSCPIGIMLEALPKGTRGKLLKYDTSGEMTGDFSHTVSYVSMVFTVAK